MLSLNALNSTQNLHIGTVVSTGGIGGQQGPQSLKDVIDKLASALTKDGHLDQDSPLGKMVAKQMEKMNPLAALAGGTPDMVKSALGEVIKDKLGDNFGAAAELGLGSGAGKPDLMSQVLNGLGKASLDDLLTKQGDGTKFSASDMPLLDQIAQFMDQNPSKFPAPDSGSWKNELKEDNFLDAKETGAFRAALDMLGTQLGQQQNGVSGANDSLGGQLGGNPLGADPSGGSQIGNPQGGHLAQDLGQLLGDLLQQGLDKNLGGGGGIGGGQGTGQGIGPNPDIAPGGLPNTGNSISQDLGQLLSGLIKDGLQANQNGNGGLGGAGGHNPAFAQHDLQSSLAQTATALVSALLGAGNNQLS
ncbi:type III secretion protein HrpZ [Pseudomonas sp. F3-2]|uniref:type III secretion protein HrpZ n=1 Tax=Pseudomonas sp. F3-2 TaxID=3141539 RepID=UPI00315CEEBD